MADIEEYKERLRAELQRICDECVIPADLLAGHATESIVRSFYPRAREINSVAFIDSAGVLHALAWARLDPEPRSFTIEIIPPTA